MASRLRGYGEAIAPGARREYNAYGLGWMYRPHGFVNDLILSQLDRLDEYNAVRRRFAGFLTRELEHIPGMKGLYTPDYADPAQQPDWRGYVSKTIRTCRSPWFSSISRSW